MRTVIKVAAFFAVLTMLVFFLIPRMWVKSKYPRLIYDGHVSEHIKLYHGSGGKLLILIDEGQERGNIYVYQPVNGIERCPRQSFAVLKMTAFRKPFGPVCENGAGNKITLESVDENDVRFVSAADAKIEIEVSWQPPPR